MPPELYRRITCMKTRLHRLSALAAIGHFVLFLSACAANDDRIGAFLVSPSGEQYEFYTCQQLLNSMKGIIASERELKARIAKAGSVASIVGGYKLDYANYHGTFVAARNTARDKSCTVPSELANDEPL